MIKKLFVFMLFACFLSVAGYGQQTRAEIQQEQNKLKDELNDLNASLNQIRKSRKLSLRELKLLERRIKARNSLIVSINDELEDLNQKIHQYNKEVEKHRKKLDTLTQKYAQSLVFAYKNRGSYNYINFLFSSNSFNDAIRRVAYLKSYREYRESQADNIKKAQAVLKKNIKKLESTKDDKKVAVKKQNAQLLGMQSDRNEKDSAIVELKSREGEIGQEIAANAKKRSKLQSVLRQVIRREIEEAERKERARQARIAKAKREEEKRARIARQQQILKEKQEAAARAAAAAKNPDEAKSTDADKTAAADANDAGASDNGVPPKKQRTAEQDNSERLGRSYNVLESTEKTLTQSLDFEKNRGKLPWPVVGGFISGSFGVQSIPGTGLTEVNDGIEITGTGGSTTVKSVASGTVSVVISDETYAVIIRHGKYFTTYSNLRDVTVGRGDEVKAGTIVGHMASGASDISTVFFMVTDSKGNSLNPMTWIKRR